MPNIDLAAKIEVDSTKINQLFHDLRMTSPEATKAVRQALRKSIVVLRSGIRNAAATVTSNRQKQRLVNVSVYKNAKGAQVNILYGNYITDGRGKQRHFTLRWLDKGTKGCIGKNGRRHGTTPAKPFFNSASQTYLPQAERILSDNIIKYINLVVQKRK